MNILYWLFLICIVPGWPAPPTLAKQSEAAVKLKAILRWYENAPSSPTRLESLQGTWERLQVAAVQDGARRIELCRKLRYLVEDYPGTQAAKRAQERIDELTPPTVRPRKEIPKDLQKPLRKSESPEQAANRKLEMAKTLLMDKKTEIARARLQDLVERYPDTPAAKEALRLLKD